MLYLISPPSIELDQFTPLLNEVLATSIASVFQLRLKNTSDEHIERACRALIPICHQHGIAFILNDNTALAKKVGADGVHLGEDDDNVTMARRLLGANKTIGVSCYNSYDRAMKLAEEGADYVSFGAFYPTTTKQPKATFSLRILCSFETTAFGL